MFDIYLYISFAVLALLFLRQISIYKEPNKINYAPIILILGFIFAFIHFIIVAQDTNYIVSIKSSLIPVVVAFMLYLVIDILHQTQKAQKEVLSEQLNKALIENLLEAKTFLKELQTSMQTYAKEEQQAKEEFALKLNKDLQTLQKLLDNQDKFMNKFQEVEKWHKDLTELFINFTEFKLPELDKIIHKHIDILRISEAEHFEKIQTYLQQTIGSKEVLDKEIKTIMDEIVKIKSLSNEIANDISHKTVLNLSKVSQSFQKELIGLQSHTQALQTSLQEGEAKVAMFKTKSNQLLTQMEYLQEMLEKLEEKKQLIDELEKSFTPLFEQIKTLKQEYLYALGELEKIATQLQEEEKIHFETIQKRVENAMNMLDTKVENYLDELKQKYIVATDNISDSVKILAKKAQMQKGYNQDSL